MRQETIAIYKFHELSEKARNKAIDNWRANDYDDYSDELACIKVFCDHFGVNLSNYNVSAWGVPDYKIEVSNNNFRGRKLKDFSRDHMPTGYWLDCSLWATFYDKFKETGSAKTAFDIAVWQGFQDLQNEMEHRGSDEYIIECIELNDYEFYANGALV